MPILVVNEPVPSRELRGVETMVAEIRPFIFVSSDGRAYWTAGGRLELRDLKIDTELGDLGVKLRVTANVEARFDTIGEKENKPGDDYDRGRRVDRDRDESKVSGRERV
jgi:hypothetical protein